MKKTRKYSVSLPRTLGTFSILMAAYIRSPRERDTQHIEELCISLIQSSTIIGVIQKERAIMDSYKYLMENSLSMRTSGMNQKPAHARDEIKKRSEIQFIVTVL
ncbi:hypothetical protein NPIL_621521 [Nephila pilipes]|uniref:Uncharacterized protein n=1 Tax=Nephila pilipes TaxID=299642 RepID=A0A8X6UKN1_NEPPI|nr:hypothetical protein NPIL_621521 [Nephila pilipes]